MKTTGSVLLAPSPTDFSQYDTMYYVKGGVFVCVFTAGDATLVAHSAEGMNRKISINPLLTILFFFPFFQCVLAAAGGICCSITHGALTPVDVVKTRVQLDSAKVRDEIHHWEFQDSLIIQYLERLALRRQLQMTRSSFRS